MSAIWGYLDLAAADPDLIKQNIDNIRDVMTEPYKNCVIERFESRTFANGFFSCGIQYFNRRAHDEILPIYDADNSTVFTADIILDARDELVKELSVNCDKDEDELKNLPDGSIAYIAWKTWKEKFVDHIQGLFAIAIFEMDTKAFYIFTDHMGHRCIHYYIDGSKIWFSTLMKPILMAVPKGKISLNEKWIVACESVGSSVTYVYPWLTPYNNMYQVVRGSFLKAFMAAGGKIEEKRVSYWNPLNDNKIIESDKSKAERDQYYKSAFIDTFFTCVKDAIDTDEDVAATISGGLDSSSVSAIAATLLKEKNKKLYGYTAVPLHDYESQYDRSTIVDESPMVRRFCELYDNIVPEFLSYEGKSSITEMDRLVRMFEVPSKSMTNLVWVDEINKKASELGCKVLLVGQFGNGTISNGSILARVYQELRAGHFMEGKRQLASFGKRYGIARKELLRVLVSQLFSKLLFDLNLNSGYKKSFDDVYSKKELLDKYRIIQYSRECDKKSGFTEMVSRDQVKQFILDETVTQNISVYDTKLSLYYGVVTRDPTRDKRMIELILSMPSDQFTDDGIERRLVREYMSDYVPGFIRNEVFRRGLQAADVTYRLKRNGKASVTTERENLLYHYLNYENVRMLFNDEMNDENVFNVLKIMALDSFIKEYRCYI
jgi:asparagine synthase (glutamine-hydrolysing)